MERFRTRPGVILAEICGEFMLVSAKKNLGICPYLTSINETSAFLWKKLADGADLESLMQAVREEYEIDDTDSAEEAVRAFLAQMIDLNYIIPEEKEQNEN